MIQRLGIKNKNDVYDFLSRVPDKYEDMYITKDKDRKFLKNDWSLIEKVLLKHEVYGLENKGLKALLIIIRDKGFRPYVKLLAEDSKYIIDMLKFLKWTYFEKDLYIKLKKNNPLAKNINKTGFIKIGDRGSEDLFFKKGLKQLFKITPKDLYLEDNENRLY